MSKWTVTAALMHLTQRKKKIENGDCGRKLRKVKSREMVLSEKMMLSELASSSFFHLLLTIFLLCYFELFPVTGAGINLFLRLRTRKSDRCILLYFGRFLYYQPVDKSGIFLNHLYRLFPRQMFYLHLHHTQRFPLPFDSFIPVFGSVIR